MDDLASLGMHFETVGGEKAAKTLDEVAANSKKAERATDSLSMASRKGNSALLAMVASIEKAIREQTAFIQGLAEGAVAAVNEANAIRGLGAEVSKATGSTRAYSSGVKEMTVHTSRLPAIHAAGTASTKAMTQATLNLTRQFADVGTTLAMGMNPLMILIQQGPQIADAFQMASTSGLGFQAVLKGLWAQLAPLLAILAPLVVAAAAVAAGFALMTREINKSSGDLTKSMGLTEKQLDRIKDKGISTSVTIGDTIAATFEVAGERLAKAFDGPLDWLKSATTSTLDAIESFMANVVRGVVALWVGGSRAIVAAWKLLPSAIGDIGISAANAMISAVEKMINGAIDRINGLIAKADGIAKRAGLGGLGQIGRVSMGQIGNPYAGAASAAASGIGGAFAGGARAGAGYTDDFFGDVGTAARQRRRKALTDIAGKAGAGAKGSTAAAPRDTSDERTAQIAAMIAQAKADELQAQLALTKDIRQRAEIEKQIAAAQLAGKQAQVDRQIASIQDDKGLSAAKKVELVAQLEAVKAAQARTGSLQQLLRDQETATALVHQEAASRQAGMQDQIDVLSAQEALARTGFERRRIDEQILELQQQIARSKAQEAVDAARAANDQAALAEALARQAALVKVQAAQTEAEKRERFMAAYDEVTSALGRVAAAWNSQDWGDLVSSIWKAAETLKAAFAKGATTADKVAGAAAIGNMVGDAIGGRGGNALSAASNAGAQAFAATGNPYVAAAAAVVSGVKSWIDGGKAKKAAAAAAAAKKAEEELTAARNAAAEAAQKLMDAENERVDLTIQLLNASGQGAAATSMTRERERAALLTDANRAIYDQVKAWTDYNDALGKADEAISAAQSNVESARSALTEAYDREASAIQATRDRFTGFIDTLNQFGAALSTGDLAMNGLDRQTALTRAKFGSTTDLALSGNEGAQSSFVDVSTQFLAASKASARNQVEYNRDLAAVRRANEALKAYASREVSVADQQLAALNAQVAGLGIVNTSVLSVAQAVNNLAAAQGALSTAQAAKDALTAPAASTAAAGADWSAGGALWSQWAAAGQAAGAGSHAVADWGRSETLFLQEYKNAAGVGSLSVLDAYWGLSPGTAASFADKYGLKKFAKGGVLGGPSLVLGGEAGDEALMPLHRGPDGNLGVRAQGGDGETAAEVQQLRGQVDQMTKVLVAIMKSNSSIDRREARQEVNGVFVRGEDPTRPVSVEPA